MYICIYANACMLVIRVNMFLINFTSLKWFMLTNERTARGAPAKIKVMLREALLLQVYIEVGVIERVENIKISMDI